MGEPAATVIVFRHARETGAAEILLVERSSRLAFAGGATVFPGGKVDPADRALAVHEMARKAREGAGLDPEDVAGRIAAVRETLEETGLLVGLVAASREAAPSRRFRPGPRE
jgi:8-oxo-dGTP pyrophosphatase MutT (NUDIX family)